MARKINRYPQEKFDLAKALMTDLAANPKGYTSVELVETLAPEIKKMLAAGYSYEDVSKALAEAEIVIAASSIKAVIKPKSDSKESLTVNKEKSTKVADEIPDSVELKSGGEEPSVANLDQTSKTKFNTGNRKDL